MYIYVLFNLFIALAQTGSFQIKGLMNCVPV